MNAGSGELTVKAFLFVAETLTIKFYECHTDAAQSLLVSLTNI